MPETKTGSIRIAVVDDHPMMRDGIVYSLQQAPGMEIVAQGETADEAVAIAEAHLPDVMLIDINMPGNGLTAIARISTEFPAIRLLVVTAREDEEAVAEALRLGARGYALKGIAGTNLREIVTSIHQGEVYVTSSLAVRLLGDQRRQPPSEEARGRRLTSLTTREREILELVATGQSNKQIANVLDITERTVKQYMSNILQKLQVQNRVEAALIARSELGKPPG